MESIMSDFQIGDELFGYPVIGLTDTTVTVRLPGNLTLDFDRSQFGEGVRFVLQQSGQWVPKG